MYLSPILQATPGSRHGYDVVDHSRVSADLGGEDAFRSMVEVFRRYGNRWTAVLDTAVPRAELEGASTVKPGDMTTVINHSLQLLRRG